MTTPKWLIETRAAMGDATFSSHRVRLEQLYAKRRRAFALLRDNWDSPMRKAKMLTICSELNAKILNISMDLVDAEAARYRDQGRPR